MRGEGERQREEIGERDLRTRTDRTVACTLDTHRRDKSLARRVYWPCTSKSRLVVDLRLVLIPIGDRSFVTRESGATGGPRIPDTEARRNGIKCEIARAWARVYVLYMCVCVCV